MICLTKLPISLTEYNRVGLGGLGHILTVALGLGNCTLMCRKRNFIQVLIQYPLGVIQWGTAHCPRATCPGHHGEARAQKEVNK